MNKQQLRFIGIIILVILACMIIKPAQKVYEYQKEINRYEAFNTNYAKNHVIPDLAKHRNDAALWTGIYLVGICIALGLIIKPQVIGSKFGIIKNTE